MHKMVHIYYTYKTSLQLSPLHSEPEPKFELLHHTFHRMTAQILAFSQPCVSEQRSMSFTLVSNWRVKWSVVMSSLEQTDS